jgi:GNAT superfamily N-acetyltransferase
VPFRDATPQDAAAIAQLVAAAALIAFEDFAGPAEMAQLDTEREAGEWNLRLAEPWDNIVFVAEHDGRVTGVAAWLAPRGPAYRTPRDAHLTHLYVHPAVQSAGVGRALLRHAEDALRQLGGRTARLSLHDANTWTAALLESSGWVREPDPPADMGPHHLWTRTL